MTGSPRRMKGGTMTVAEATNRARNWWQEYRGAIRRTFNQDVRAPMVRDAVRRSAGVSMPAVIVKNAPEEVLDDGILSGKPWEALTLQEQAKIRDLWHRNMVVAPAKGRPVVDMHRVGRGRIGKTERRKRKD